MVNLGQFYEQVNALQLVEMGHDEIIYTMEIGERYVSGLFHFFPFIELVFKHCPAHHSCWHSAWNKEQKAEVWRRMYLQNWQMTPAVVGCWSSSLASLSLSSLIYQIGCRDRFEMMDMTRGVQNRNPSLGQTDQSPLFPSISYIVTQESSRTGNIQSPSF